MVSKKNEDEGFVMKASPNGKSNGIAGEGIDHVQGSNKEIDEGSEKSKKSEKEDIPSVPYWKLFRYARGFDYFLIVVGTLSGMIHGAGLPALFIVFGELTTDFTTYGRYQQCDLEWATCLADNLTNLTEAEWNEQILPDLQAFRGNSIQFVLYFVYIAVAVLVLASLQTGCWSMQAARQIKRIRSEYFYAILRQDTGFHDVTSSGELSVRLSGDVNKVKDGIAEKVSTSIQYLSMCLSGLIVGLVYSWKLGLVTLSVAPLIGLASALLLTVSAIFTKKELAAYAKAGSIAEEAISSIRTVVAFGCQGKEVDRYYDHLGEAKKVGIRSGFMGGFSIGLLYLTIFGMYGLAFWYGTTLVIAGEITIGNLTTCFFGILIAAFSLGTVGSSAGAFSEAKAAGAKIFEVIDRVPIIDIFSASGDPPSDSSGEVRFQDVEFSYPSRPEVEVLKGVSLKIEHGKTTALVGQSGSGKSTIIQLIQRFYDVKKGSVLVANNNVTSLNVRHYRDQIGVVSQEPVLFATTIAENIRWGRDGVTDDEVVEAAKQANAYDFIMKFPQKFETLVGEGGGHMSGGQKQRIAIARAIARNPKILLLDEATSALDTESESIVQAALEKAAAGRTTVVIAHRLSTIRNADKIIAFQDGKVMEEGSHDELLKIEDGVYANLINMQAGREDDDDKQDDEEHMSDVDLSPDHEVAVVSDGKMIRQRTLSNRSGSTINRASSIRQSQKKTLENGIGKSKVKNDEEEDDEEEDLPDVGFMRVLDMNKPEWPYMAVGCIFAAMAGSLDPVNAILFAEVLNIFTLSNPDEQLSRATLFGLLFLALGGVGFFSYILEGTLFAKSGVELTLRLRRKAFSSMLRQEIAYFDDHKNSTGALCTRLATDASRVQGSTGVRLGLIVKNFCSLGVALGISFAYGWQLTLLTMAFIPFLVLGGFLEVKLLTGQEEGEKEAYEEAGQVAVEAIKNIRTVASLTKELVMYETYLKKLEAPFKKATKRSIIIGLGYGYSQCVIYFAYAAVFRLGVELVITEEMTFENVFKVLTAVIFGAMAIGQNSSFAPDYAQAVLSSKRMFALFDRVPDIDSYSKEGISPDHCKGEIKLESIFFRYPTRPDIPVLRGCSISVKPGQTLALVGQSGCGKSTSVQLIERFYDPEAGAVTLDGVDISKLNIGWLRQQMGLVSQEPVLFDQSIAENIRYGDCSREASDSEVEVAAKNANIHNFIADLPDGYATSVGAKGGQLSGGQKQRVAIARALLRNPKILLLDEATSALDAESERIVQDALDAAREGRTSIIIAHRLSTVRNADQIAVIDNGLVAEVGTHDELIALKGAYFSLVNAQLSAKDKE